MNEAKLTKREIEELFNFAKEDERFGVAFRGALSQVRLKMHLEDLGCKVVNTQSDNLGNPDFIVNGQTLEHKRAKNKIFNDGILRAEFQKSRGKIPQRLYNTNFSDIVSVDISHHTGIQNDYRYAKANSLRPHPKHKNKIASIQLIDEKWTSSLKSLINTNTGVDDESKKTN